MLHFRDIPRLLFADYKGKIYSHPTLRMVGADTGSLRLPHAQELISFPEGGSLFYLPGRVPVGFDPDTNQYQPLAAFEGKPVCAVAAFLIPAFLRLYNPAMVTQDKEILPLWAYTACGFHKGRFVVAATRIDARIRQSPRFYDSPKVAKSVRAFLKKSPKNRLYQHLAHCALNYNCLAAKNMFLKRWEAPLPTAQSCNACCVGCLSHQPNDCVASHQRIQFRPSAEELVEVMYNHLKVAREAIVSFGQGCEGEPLLEAATIAEAVAQVREKTSRGTINMNTNASLPSRIEALCKAGVDSFRVSLNSTRKEYYNRYFKPKRYSFQDVLTSIALAKKYKKFVSVNLFVFPGFTDCAAEVKSLRAFIAKHKIDMIQWRNLNIDPVVYEELVASDNSSSQGILSLVASLRKVFPRLKMGYFNLPKEQF